MGRKLGQPRSTRGANGSLMEKHFTTLETDFTLETLLPWRKGTLSCDERLEAFKRLRQFAGILKLSGIVFEIETDEIRK